VVQKRCATRLSPSLLQALQAASRLDERQTLDF
jgi:hypothetical protein